MNNNVEDVLETLESLNIYETVRLIDVNTCEEYSLQNGTVQKGVKHCFEMWKKHGRCENCISAKAYSCKGKCSKFEFVNNTIYHVNAKYLEFNETPYVLECITKEDILSADPQGKEVFVNTILEQNRKVYKDPLTNVFNRDYYEEILKNLHISACALIHIDDFETIKKVHGNLRSDMVVQTIAYMISRKVRKTDSIVRFSEDEFLLVFPDINDEVILHRLEEIRYSIEHHDFKECKSEPVSISVAALITDACDEKNIEKVSELLEEAKLKKNTFIYR